VAGAAGLLVVGLLLGTGACGGPDPVRLTVWVMDPGSDQAQAVVEGMVADFEAGHDRVTVEVEYVPWAEGYRRFEAAAAGGPVPDVAEMGTTWTPGFAPAIAPVEGDLGGYVPSLVQAGTVGGTAYGYPWYGGARALIYRADVLADLDARPPEDWQALLALGDTIAERTDLAPLHLAGNHLHLLAPMVWGAGGEIATERDGVWTSGVDTPQGRAGFELLATLWERGWSPDEAVGWTSVEIRDAFAAGESAMMAGGSWDLAAVLAANPDLAGDLGVAVMPAGPGGVRDAFAVGSHLVVFQASDDRSLAAELARHLSQPSQATGFARALGYLPGTLAGVEAAVGGDELLGGFGSQLVEHSRSYPAAGWWHRVEEEAAFQREIQRVMRGEQTPAEAAANVAAAIDAAARS
jgi:N,N'-diacetylchitobiose transport system substrate-binding protein